MVEGEINEDWTTESLADKSKIINLNLYHGVGGVSFMRARRYLGSRNRTRLNEPGCHKIIYHLDMKPLGCMEGLS